MKETTMKLTRAMIVTAVLSAFFATGYAGAEQMTAEQNMEKQRKQHLISGKTLKAKGPNYQFCEVAPIMGTTKENAVANFYNPTGIAHCTAEDFEKIVAQKDQIIKDAGAIDVFLNPSRYWTWDEFEIYEVGEEMMFGPVKMAWMAVVPMVEMKKAVGDGHYHPSQIYRNNKFLYKKGTRVYLLDMPNGNVLVMQSWTSYVIKDQTADKLKDLGSMMKLLPEGWKFRTKVLDRDLTVSPPPPTHLGWVTMDEFMNTYQGCGYDAACNYVP